MKYALSEHITFPRLFRVVLPSILMMVSISVYSVVDGAFISNVAGPTPFAAVNLIFPLIMLLASLGFMMGSGGAALVAKRLGEGKSEEANRAFSNCVFFSILVGVVTSVAVYFALPYLAVAMQADEKMLPYCIEYGRIMVLGVTFFNLQNLFQSFFTAAERPQLGFYTTLTAGVVNIVLDAVLIVACDLGVLGAAIGTVAGQAVGAIIPIVYFVRKNGSPLRLKWVRFVWKDIGRMAGNGISEFVNNISASAVSIALNAQLMAIFGEDGVGAYGIICYVWMIFAATFIGTSIAIGPRISYALGAGNKTELTSLYRKSVVVLLVFGAAMFALAEALAIPLAMAYAGSTPSLYEITVRASRIYSIIYLFLGVNMFGSSFFTALNNGLVSMLLSLVRLAGLELVFVSVFPLIFGGESIWYAVPAANFFGLGMNLVVMQLFSRRYGYNAKEVPLFR